MSWTKKPPASLTEPQLLLPGIRCPDLRGQPDEWGSWVAVSDQAAAWKRAFSKAKQWWEKPMGTREWGEGFNRPWLPRQADYTPGEYKPDSSILSRMKTFSVR